MDCPPPHELRPLGPTALAPFAEKPEEALGEIFEFSSFRPGQRRVIECLVAGDDAVVVMPTGAGKSLCYQLAAALIEGLALVVSPLIALMNDQVESLASTGLPATAIHSAMSRAEQRRRIDAMYAGDYKLVYVSPERFRSSSFRKALTDVRIGLFVVDEAHCISQWGHDFRPDYRRLAKVRRALDQPQTAAFTATATEVVRDDIAEQLAIEDGRRVVTGFERPNLYFEVFRASDKRDKIDRMQALIDYYDGESVIVYAATRKQVRRVHRTLVDRGIDAGRYHGGMNSSDRRRTHRQWRQGQRPVLVATNAFGMGVDKPDVRAVIHYCIPSSVQAYYQEAGRAGRDGRPAHCLLLFNRADTEIHEWLMDHSQPMRMEVIRVWLHLRQLGIGTHETTAADIAEQNPGPGKPMHPMVVQSCLRLLAQAGHMRRRGDQIEVFDDVEPLELNIDFSALGKRRVVATEQLSQVVDFASTSRCLQRVLVEYFGHEPEFGAHCGRCAVCDPPPEYEVAQSQQLRRHIAFDGTPKQLGRAILRGVGRAGGKRGPATVAAMLIGSRSKAVRSAGFDRLQSHGALAELRKKDVVYLIELFARHRLIRRDERDCVLLTSEGAEVMQGATLPESLQRKLKRDLDL